MRSKSLWNQHLDALAQQFLARVAEQSFNLRIHQNNRAAFVHHQHSDRRRLQRQPKLLVGSLALGRCDLQLGMIVSNV